MKLLNFQTIATLDLGDNALGDRGADALSDVKKNQEIKKRKLWL